MPLKISEGGTSQPTAAGARKALGIDGGTISPDTVNATTITTTDLSVVDTATIETVNAGDVNATNLIGTYVYGTTVQASDLQVDDTFDINGIGSISVGPLQTNATFGSRGITNALEFGHTNSAGYGSTLGHYFSNGRPALVFNGELDTSGNTITTRGIRSSILRSDLIGGWVFENVATANAAGQTPTTQVSISNTGAIVAGVTTVSGFTLQNTAPFITIKDTSGAGAASTGYVAFLDDADIRQGYIGNASAANSNLFFTNEISNANIQFDTVGTGTVVLTNGGLAFPATAVAHAGANTLDDYEEGTWTPTFSPTTGAFGSITYTSTTGTYTKIGNQVTIHFRILTSALTVGTASGQLRIAGMPFTNASANFSGGVGFTTGWTAKPTKHILSGGLILLYKESNVTTDTTHSVTDMNAASTNEIRGTLTYHT